jgi:hypothetical protein
MALEREPIGEKLRAVRGRFYPYNPGSVAPVKSAP